MSPLNQNLNQFNNNGLNNGNQVLAFGGQQNLHQNQAQLQQQQLQHLQQQQLQFQQQQLQQHAAIVAAAAAGMGGSEGINLSEVFFIFIYLFSLNHLFCEILNIFPTTVFTRMKDAEDAV